MADLQLDRIAEQLGPDWINLGILLAVSLVLAFIVTVVVPALPRRRAHRMIAEEIMPRRKAVAAEAPQGVRQHWMRVGRTLEAEFERTEAIAGLQAAATRQIDAVEFALIGLYADLAPVSSHARRQHEKAKRASAVLDLSAAA